MKRLKIAKISAVLLLSVLAVSIAAYALVRYDASIQNTAYIKGYEVALWRMDTGAAVSSIAWGSVDLGTTIDSDTILGLTHQLAVKNTGDYAISVSWNYSGLLPSGVTLTCSKWMGSAYTDWPQNVIGMGINAGTVGSIPIDFFLTIPSDAPRGAINFTINLLASNST